MYDDNAFTFQKMSKTEQRKPKRKPFDKINGNKMKAKAPKKKGVKLEDKKVRQSISNGELIKVFRLLFIPIPILQFDINCNINCHLCRTR